MVLEVLIGLIATLAGHTSYEVIYKHLEKFINKKLSDEKVARPTNLKQLKEQAARAEEKTDAIEIFNEANSAIESALSTVRRIQKERQRQAALTFNAAFIITIAGTFAIIAGVILLIFTQKQVAGGIVVGAGAVLDIFGAVLFKFYKDANDRLDQLAKEDRMLLTADIAFDIARKIETKKTRDETLQKLAIELTNNKEESKG